jgi:hypothetical protein
MKLNGHHETTLRKIFGHPLNHNLQWREVASLLEHVGSVEPLAGERVLVKVGEGSATLDIAHHHHDHALSDVEVIAVRHLLLGAGVTPDAVE